MMMQKIDRSRDPLKPKRTHRKVINRRKLKNTNADEPKRTVRVSVSLTPDEAALLDERRGGIQRGTFFRELFLQSPNVLRPPLPAINVRAYVELARSAANLNQLMKAYNESGIRTEIQELRELLGAFRLALIDAARGVLKERKRR